jgi:hypothetical protein
LRVKAGVIFRYLLFLVPEAVKSKIAGDVYTAIVRAPKMSYSVGNNPSPRETAMGLNKHYKDSVFSLLFSEPDILRELYGAICGVSLDPSIPVTINTLEGALFMERINDISFEIAHKLVILLEHQSTINPNMALRLLIYIARIYEKIIDNRKIYSVRKIALPRPEFIVLYNGVEPYPDESVLRLSDAFEESGLPVLSAIPALELEVKVYKVK